MYHGHSVIDRTVSLVHQIVGFVIRPVSTVSIRRQLSLVVDCSTLCGPAFDSTKLKNMIHAKSSVKCNSTLKLLFLLLDFLK